MVPIGALRWYRFERYDGTDSSAAVVPIQALRWYRFADIINLALRFNGFDYMEYEHYRIDDPYGIIVICYDGTNYERMMHLFYGKKTRKMFPENNLVIGKHYYLDRSNLQLKALTFEQHCVFRVKYPNLIFYNWRFPLCITYNIAVYKSKFFPDLHFVNLLNYNDFEVDTQIYTANSLAHEPQDSRARHEKVWIVIDENGSLKRCNVSAIPIELFEEYKNMLDYTGVTVEKYRFWASM